jgi:antitoxin ParD1/3/4
MVDMTLSLPDEVKKIIEAQVGDDAFATTGDYIADLVSRDHDRRLEELRRIVADGLASGVSERTTADIFADAVEIARRRGTLPE